MNEKVIIFSAPSGSGKTTVLKELMKTDLPLAFSISATSRKQREGEIDGKDYYFFSPEEFRQKIKENAFLEWEEVYDNQFYGTLKSEITRIHETQKHVVFDVDVLGGMNIKKEFGKNAYAVFLKPPSLEVLKERLIGRGTETAESLQKRLEKAVFEISHAPKFDYVLVNDDLKETINQAYTIISNFLKND